MSGSTHVYSRRLTLVRQNEVRSDSILSANESVNISKLALASRPAVSGHDAMEQCGDAGHFTYSKLTLVS